jgi:hypothetical protein
VFLLARRLRIGVGVDLHRVSEQRNAVGDTVTHIFDRRIAVRMRVVRIRARRTEMDDTRISVSDRSTCAGDGDSITHVEILRAQRNSIQMK